MRPKPRARTQAALLASTAAMLGALASEAVAAQAPLPLPVASAESLVTEGVTVEGPLINNITLPMTK